MGFKMLKNCVISILLCISIITAQIPDSLIIKIDSLEKQVELLKQEDKKQDKINKLNSIAIVSITLSLVTNMIVSLIVRDY